MFRKRLTTNLIHIIHNIKRVTIEPDQDDDDELLINSDDFIYEMEAFNMVDESLSSADKEPEGKEVEEEEEDQDQMKDTTKAFNDKMVPSKEGESPCSMIRSQDTRRNIKKRSRWRMIRIKNTRRNIGRRRS